MDRQTSRKHNAYRQNGGVIKAKENAKNRKKKEQKEKRQKRKETNESSFSKGGSYMQYCKVNCHVHVTLFQSKPNFKKKKKKRLK